MTEPATEPATKTAAEALPVQILKQKIDDFTDAMSDIARIDNELNKLHAERNRTIENRDNAEKAILEIAETLYPAGADSISVSGLYYWSTENGKRSYEAQTAVITRSRPVLMAREIRGD